MASDCSNLGNCPPGIGCIQKLNIRFPLCTVVTKIKSVIYLIGLDIIVTLLVDLRGINISQERISQRYVKTMDRETIYTLE